MPRSRRVKEDGSDSDSSRSSSQDSPRSGNLDKNKESSKYKSSSSSKPSQESRGQSSSGRTDAGGRSKHSSPAKMSSPRPRGSAPSIHGKRSRLEERDERGRDSRQAGRHQEKSRDRSWDNRGSRRAEEKDRRERDASSGDKHRSSELDSAKSYREKDKNERRSKDSRKSPHSVKKSASTSAKSRPSASKKKEDNSSSSEDSSDSDSSASDSENPGKETKRASPKPKPESSGRTVEMSSSFEDNPPPNKSLVQTSDSAKDSEDTSSHSDDDDGEKKQKRRRYIDVKKSEQRRDHSDDNEKREVILKDDVEKLGDTPEKERNVKMMEEGEVEDDADEEKEEGEISEEDDAPAKPLIAINEDMSDISSEDETQIQPIRVGQQAKPDSIRSPHTPPLPSAEDKSDVEESTPPRKVERTIVSGESPARRDEEDSSTRKVVVPKKDQKKGVGDGEELDKSYSDGEDEEDSRRRRRERPILESESEEDEAVGKDGKSGVRSHVESKGRMGSSVSVVKPKENARDRGRDEGRRRESRRQEGSTDRRRYDDTKRDDRRRRNDGGPGRGVGGDRRTDENTRRREDQRDDDDPTQRKPSSPGKVEAAPKETSAAATKKKPAGDITTKTGGAYIPPAKLRMMQEQITDKTSAAYQRMSWEALKKSINGLINKVNVSNIINIIEELFQENIVRGRGLLARSVIQAQAASPTFTHVYAALVAIVNTKFPQNGELIMRRLILMFRRGYRRNDKALCLSSTRFIAHLVNQQVAHEVLALEILTLLLESPTGDSVEIAIGFLKECGQKLTEVSPRGVNSTFERLRNILHEGQVDIRVEGMVTTMFAIRKDGFTDHPAVMEALDLVREEEQFTHLLQLEDAVNGDEILNVFKEDKNFAESEEKYKALKKEILGEGSSDEESDEGSSGSESSESDEEAEERENAEKQKILDQTETNLVALRRTIYLTIQSSLDHNECAHKMLKMELKPGQEVELCNMILDCCAQLRTYEKFFGLLAQRFCQIDKKYIEPFQQIFCEQYETIHRLETNKLRNVAKFFSHMLHTDAISWGVLSVVKLTEEDTTSASRIFLKILFQELSEFLGLLKLNQRLKDPTLAPFFEGIMPRDNPKNTRFSINFFTTIGLGGLTDDLREHLKNVTKQIVQEKQEQAQAELAHKPSSSSSSDDSSSDDSSDSSDSSDSESDSQAKRKKKPSSASAIKKRRSGEKTSVKSKGKREEKGDKGKERSDNAKRKSNSAEHTSHDRSDRDKERGKDTGAKDKGSRSGRRDKRAMNGRGKGSPEKGISIAARLLSMAQYGDIAHAAEEAAPEPRKNGAESWKNRDPSRESREQFADRGKRRRDRSAELEETRDRERGADSRERWDQSLDKSNRWRDDPPKKNRRNDREEISKGRDREFHKEVWDNSETGHRRERENRNQQNGSRGSRHEVKDFSRERDHPVGRGRYDDEGRREMNPPPKWHKASDGGARSKPKDDDRNRQKEGKPRGGGEKKKQGRHDSSSESSGESSASEDSDDMSDQGSKRKQAARVAKSSDSKLESSHRKRQLSSPLPTTTKRKRQRNERSSASPSSSSESSDEETSARKVTINRRGPPSDGHKVRVSETEGKKIKSTFSAKQTQSKSSTDQHPPRKRPRSVSSSGSGSESDSSDSSSDSSVSGDGGSHRNAGTKGRGEKPRGRDAEDRGQRREKEINSGTGRVRDNRVRGDDSRRSRERRGRR